MKVENISRAIQITVVTTHELREHLEGYIQITVVTRDRGLEPYQWPRCFLEQETLPLLLSTGWL